MKPLMYVVCAAALFGFLAAAVVAAEETQTLTGKIVSVKEGTLTVMPTGGQGEADHVVVKTTDDTKVTLDGKDATVSDLKAQMKVVIVHKDKVAQRITATTPRSVTE